MRYRIAGEVKEHSIFTDRESCARRFAPGVGLRLNRSSGPAMLLILKRVLELGSSPGIAGSGERQSPTRQLCAVGRSRSSVRVSATIRRRQQLPLVSTNRLFR